MQVKSEAGQAASMDTWPATGGETLAASTASDRASAHYGMAFDATADEQSTWQLEPFFWSNGASLTSVNTPAFQQSLQLWTNMVKWTAIQAAITGTASTNSALQTAQGTISGISKVSG